MLKNMRVGTKLVAILVAPLVALGVLAGLGVADRLAGAADARRGERLGALANGAAEAAQALELEQLWAAVVSGAADAGGSARADAVAAYERSVAQSEQALAQVRAALDRVDDASTELDDRADVFEDRIADLAPLRDSVRTDEVDPVRLVEYHQPALDAINGLIVASAGEPVAPGTAAYLQYLSILSRAKVSTAEAFAYLTAISAGSLPAGEVPEKREEAQDALARADRRYETFFEEADPEFKALLRNVQSSVGSGELDQLAAQIGQTAPDAGSGAGSTGAGTGGTGGVAVGSLVNLASERLQGELEVQREITTALADQAGDARASAVRTVRLYLLGAALGILAALGLAFLVARATTRPLRQLTDAANQLAGEQLPRLVERLRTPDPSAEPVRLAPIPIGSRDEIGQLAQAINQIQRTTTDVAEEQASLLRKGISDIFVNLARRNQALLDRQIEFIDQLESNEADPDQLDNLFRLDHLATRMRRNAESLLVLAGADPPRRRGRPVPLADVVRVAIGEVEDFARVNLLALDDVAVAANVAVDLSHVVAELMDNATQFSPPETLVEVVGHRNEEGSYVLSVSDPGIGMGAEQLAEANHELAHPPMMGLTLGRSLGFVVIGRLAARHDISVRLVASTSGGVTALVTLPAGQLDEDSADPLTPADPWALSTGRRGVLAAPASAAIAAGAGVAEAPARPEPVPALVGGDAGRAAPGDGTERANGRHTIAAPPAVTGGPPAVPTPIGSDWTRPGGAPTGAPADEAPTGVEPARADHGAPADRTDAGGGGTGPPVGPAPASPAPADGTGRLLSTAPHLHDGGRAAPAGLFASGGPPPVWPASPRRPGPPSSSDGGQSFTYNDDGDDGDSPDTAWVARLLARPPQQPAGPPPLSPAPLPDPSVPAGPGMATSSAGAHGSAGSYGNGAPAPGPVRPPAAGSPDAVADTVTGGTAPPPVAPLPRRISAAERLAGQIVDDGTGDQVAPAMAVADTGAGPGAVEAPRPVEPGSAPPAVGSSVAAEPAAGDDHRPADDQVPTDDGAVAGSAPLPGREPARPEPAGPDPVGPDPVGPDPVELGSSERPDATVTPIWSGRQTAGGERGGELTAAGLMRRSPKQQIRNLTVDAAGSAGRPPTTQRSPEEVRQILSRYRTGLQRGRTTRPPVGTDDDRGAPEGAADAEEQR